MTNKIEYVIWGISEDKGYEITISSSYDNNIIPNDFALSKSFDDGIDTIMFDFASENKHRQQYYLYSIERVGSSVLYTIYRTGWERGPREAYNALTLIINKNYLLKNPVISLKKLMSHYVSLSDSGIRNFNISDLVSTLDLSDKSPSQKRKIISNSTHVYQQKQDKKAYIKYSSETELHNVFIDDSSLFKFNKVFFFTALKSLEIGSNKLNNIKDFHPIKLTIHNFKSQYHKLLVDSFEKSYSDNFEAYEGENIQILLKSTGNTLKSISVDSKTKIIQLDYIEPEKPNNTRKSFFSKNKEHIIYFSIIFLMSIIILVLMFPDQRITLTKNINKFFKKSPKQTNDQNYDLVQHESTRFALLKYDKFIDEKDNEITDSQILFNYLKDAKLVIDTINFFTVNDEIYKFQDDKEDKVILKINELIELNKILDNINPSLTKDVNRFIQKIILYKNNKINTKDDNESSDSVEFSNNNEDVESTPKVIIKKIKEEDSSEKVVIDCFSKKEMEEIKIKYNERKNKFAFNWMKQLKVDVEDEVADNPGIYTNRIFLDKFLIAMESCKCPKCDKWKMKKEKYKESYDDLKELKEWLIELNLLKDEKKS